MMELKITVLLQGMSEAINRLADAISGNQIPAQAPAKLIGEKPFANHPHEGETSNSTPAVPNNPAPFPNNTPAVPNIPAPVPNNVTAFPTQSVAPTSSVAPVTASPVVAPAAVTAPASTPVGREYNLDELARAAAVLMDNGKMAELAALVQKYGVPSLMQLDKSYFNAFAEDLKRLGAVL